MTFSSPLSSSAPLEPAASEEDRLLDRVTVLVVTYESAHCLADLDRLLSACPNVILVDNASTDGTATQAQALWPQAQVIGLDRNLGFGAANNRGLAQVHTPLALLLNPDCQLSRENLVRLIQVAEEHPQASIVAPQLLKRPGPQASPDRPGTAVESVDFVSGAAMLWRLSHFQGLGYFDESFFLYYEDTDLCRRLFAAQRPILLARAITALHEGRRSVKGRARLAGEYARGYWHARSKLLFLEKHESLASARRTRAGLLLGTTLALPLRALFFSPRLISRMLGRWQGLASWKPRSSAGAAQ